MIYIKKEINKKEIIQELLLKNNVDALLIYNPKNRLWYTQFNSTEGYLLVSKNKSYLYVDGRYITAAKNSAKNIDKIIEFGDVFELIKKDIKELKIKSIGFENDFITYNHYNLLKKMFSGLNLVSIDTRKIRVIKSNKEIELIHKACKISDNAFNEILKKIKKGMSEISVDKIIFSSFMDQGADGFSFSTIVASGKNGALPHWRASDKKINNNELVTIDFGCYYKGYSSDITRTIAIGKNIDSELIKIYNIVKEAQFLGIKSVKPGISTKEIDTICRNYIIKKGYGDYFKHSTGHGLGIDVHEFPRVSQYCDIKLETGMIITVEPGIYIPKFGGVRIEDDILVTDNGYKKLTNSSTDLIHIT